ncbi:MAG: metallophosphatase family protein [Bacteroidota bacterium]|nr:metallophosphatase family protein [Bacteroidota bacterium]MDX5505978.1 metallophosphatase family protein [Bacteroidota bacterium]
MKKILLLSDTHGHLDERILSLCETVDEVWHAGDIGDLSVTDRIQKVRPLRAVFGNIDGAEARREFPRDQQFDIEGLKVFMTHIGGYPGRYAPGIRERLSKDPPGLFICGHSHILKVMPDKVLKLLHMNPGAAGRSGFHKIRTMLRFKVSEGRVNDLEVIELGPR